ncbi:bifunctional 4-hydroxy-2-oxoglutarate aldolase/2-dehydro-3-deoxy-phosphogluconate aldolase [Virgibacillus sp. MSJ-26]|uniref:bifunctional 4-hydroxy-2-oxoglutarate aldolase/2-dehydro-3-deoxy-phosphogluconate aldolase n=1 Tax=Virgibacillus sp. MSJ-26 TaxID=2841522 RepID=UPI001C0F96CA|nr:bifunctional 4-hydroxy-2-oxoglutarate aldolase/2-dehydro-3-deoxy-phosphogluconate aldolase [Virgibacillus sp. MSJ-26]MBU5468234.1 bifunctional 4-hydroxy-2-oxoglutarate aldolase/2-dehydro-3-deoxy-phosphogluconate aldolase [Virgibacillus sp. MSJ-26]
MNTLQDIKKNKVVAIIRKANEENILDILYALESGGIRDVEITAETPRISRIIERATDGIGDRINIGAGTVLDTETARNVLLAGASFIVSPTLNIETLKLTNRYNVLNIPGVFSPTEILTAFENGAKMVKIFPANILGPDYIKSIIGPLPFVETMVTGGITLDNMNDYLYSGASVVGIGSNLVNALKLKTDADYEQLKEKTQKYVAKLNCK